MSEDEKKLREWIGRHTDSPNGSVLLELLLCRHRAEVELLRQERDAENRRAGAARNAALDGVAREAQRRAALVRASLPGTETSKGAGDALDTLAGDLRASMSTPAQVVPVAMVLDATKAPMWTDDMPTERGAGFREGFEKAMLAVRKRLGLPLDAEGAGEKDTRLTCTCLDKGRCRGPEGLGKGWKCALGREALPVYDEPAHAPTPGTCKGCDAKADAPLVEHRLSCTVYGKRQVVLPATREAAGDFRAECAKCPHPPHYGACSGRNGQTANPCPCLYTTRDAAGGFRVEVPAPNECRWCHGPLEDDGACLECCK